jgi:tripartite-type tricarboxylate transporter receptor subunit TctC
MNPFNTSTRASLLPCVPSIAAGALGLLMTASIHAQPAAFPSKPVRIIVPSAPGGGVDNVARMWADCASPKLGQTVVVENRAGANGIPAIQALKQSDLDGHTVLLAGMSQLTITPYVFAKPPYDVQKDIEGISLVLSSPYILAAAPGSNIQNIAGIASATDGKAGGLNFGSPGNGSPAHLMSAILGQKLGVKFTHIPFQGEAPLMTNLIGNQVDLAPFIVGTALEQARAGRIKPLAILGQKRLDDLPQVPTIAEALNAPELSHGSWTAIVSRAGTPAAAVEKLHAVTQQCLAEPAVQRRIATMNGAPLPAPSSAVAAYVKRDTALWRPLVQQLGVRND